MSSTAKLAVGCIAVAFLLPLGDSGGDYFGRVARFLVAGAVVMAVVPRLEARKRQRMGTGGSGKRLRAEATRTLDVPLSRDDAFERAHAALSSLRRARVTKADREAGVLAAKTGPTLKSFGEEVQVQVSDAPGGGARVEVTSASTIFATSADREKNDENVVIIVRAFEDQSGGA